jgi:hypothetical protein
MIDDMDMEELSMKGNSIEKKAVKAKREKRRKIEKLKRLVGIDPWENEDELMVSDAAAKLVDFVKFMKDPLVKSEFKPSAYKTAVNGLIDAANVLESLSDDENDVLLKKVK